MRIVPKPPVETQVLCGLDTEFPKKRTGNLYEKTGNLHERTGKENLKSGDDSRALISTQAEYIGLKLRLATI